MEILGASVAAHPACVAVSNLLEFLHKSDPSSCLVAMVS